jgi:hypothetical protein
MTSGKNPEIGSAPDEGDHGDHGGTGVTVSLTNGQWRAAEPGPRIRVFPDVTARLLSKMTGILCI